MIAMWLALIVLQQGECVFELQYNEEDDVMKRLYSRIALCVLVFGSIPLNSMETESKKPEERLEEDLEQAFFRKIVRGDFFGLKKKKADRAASAGNEEQAVREFRTPKPFDVDDPTDYCERPCAYLPIQVIVGVAAAILFTSFLSYLFDDPLNGLIEDTSLGIS